ncbi:MAG: hypothetical protein F6J92_21580 [Symploca sp. SIO1A3]|nr:hypothetical protein [Symploca sp. SIO1A3]
MGGEVEIIEDECNIGISLVPIFGFMALPNIDLVYRKPGCRDKKPRRDRNGSNNAGFPDIPDDYYGFFAIALNEVYDGSFLDNGCNYTDDQSILSFVFNLESVVPYPSSPSYISHYRIDFTSSFQWNHLSDACHYHSRGFYQVQEAYRWEIKDSYTGFANLTRPAYRHYLRGKADFAGRALFPLQREARNKRPSIYIELLVGSWGKIRPLFENRNKDTETHQAFGRATEGTIEELKVERQIWKILNFNDEPEKLAPPPPRRPRDMSCCPQTNYMLREVLRQVRIANKRIGSDDFPASVPASLIESKGGGNTSVENLTQLTGWFFKRFDEVMGQWEVPIEVKDTDPEKEGNQKEDLILPNLAEAVGEMFGLILQLSINSEVIFTLASKSLVESGQGKSTSTQNNYLLEALLDYLGVDLEAKKDSIPLSFTPGAESLSEFLERKELEVEKPTFGGGATLKESLQDLLHAAAVIRSVYWRQLDNSSEGGLASQIVDLVKKQKENKTQINKEIDDKDWDKFLNDTELGYTNKVGIKDSQNPYNRPFSQRPRILELGDSSDNPGGTPEP